jgi:hypothetical protein
LSLEFGEEFNLIVIEIGVSIFANLAGFVLLPFGRGVAHLIPCLTIVVFTCNERKSFPSCDKTIDDVNGA